MPEFPDEYLYPIITPLDHYVTEAAKLLEDPPYPHAFIQFILAGQYGVIPNPDSPATPSDRPVGPPNLGWYRIFVNATQNLTPPVCPTVVGDFDSVIGITKKLPFKKAITWHIIPLFRETLTKNVHITRKILVGVRNLFYFIQHLTHTNI